MNRNLRLFCGFALVLATAATSYLGADAFGVPRSNQVFEGEVQLPSGISARFYVRDGTMLTVRDLDAGQWYGFVPVINPETNQPNFSASVIKSLPGGGERVEELNPGVDIQRRSTYAFSMPGGTVEVRVLGVKMGRFSKVVVDPRSRRPSELQKLYGAVGGGLCVLTCGGVTVGANAVEMDCGACQGDGIDF